MSFFQNNYKFVIEDYFNLKDDQKKVHKKNIIEDPSFWTNEFNSKKNCLKKVSLCTEKNETTNNCDLWIKKIR